MAKTSKKKKKKKISTIPIRQSDAGRPPELDRSLIKKIIAPLRMALPVVSAAALQGISYELIRLWILKGKEEPNSIYGELVKSIEQTWAEWETRDLSIIDQHATGRPAEYEMEVVRTRKGEILNDPKTGQPLMQVARDSEGNPIIKRHAIQSDWKAALERLSRRKPRYWSRKDPIDLDGEAVMTFDNKKPETKEAISFEQRIAQAIEKLEEDV